MNPMDLEALEETFEILSNPNAMDEIQRAEIEIERGDYLSADDLRRASGMRGADPIDEIPPDVAPKGDA